jgi:methylmalonyl-CoA mutase cobalamin-binding subunit
MPSDQQDPLTGTVGMDAHVIGTKIVSRAFREAGFNLGILAPLEEFAWAAMETNADAIPMSSLVRHSQSLRPG